jgi:uncharacterized protein (TIGR02001 family)
MVGLALGTALLPAMAQWSGAASLMSDYQYHGVSLSSGRPAAQVAANYDWRHGMYAGASVTRADIPYSRSRSLLAMYAGLARPLSERYNWEAGAMRVRYPGDSSIDYNDFYTGLTGQHGNLRLHYMPAYLGNWGRTAYLELNLVRPLSEHFDLFLHAGHLHNWNRPAWGSRPRPRNDIRAGIAAGWETWTVQLAASHAGEPSDSYGYGRSQQRPRELVLSVSRAF